MTGPREAALAEAVQKAADDPAEVFARLDALSRERALTDRESITLARAIKALDNRSARTPSIDRPQRCLAILKRAAEAGARCPSNGDIADMLGIASTGAASEIVSLLEAAGHITVERSRTSRIVTIVATGHRTAGIPIKRRAGDWTEDQDAILMDGLAEGEGFTALGKLIGKSKHACISRFNKIRAEMGAQAA